MKAPNWASAALAMLVAALGPVDRVHAQAISMTPELQKIVDAAKAEKIVQTSSGELVFGGRPTEARAKAWIKENFGIDIDFQYTPGGPFGVVGNKIATEFRAGQPSSVDAWAASPPQYDPLLKLDMFIRVPWEKLYPARIKSEMVEADSRALATSTGTPGILYNLEKGADFANVKVIDDLLKPEYKGKFGTTSFANGFDAMAAKSWVGEAPMVAYMEKLGKQAQGILNCGNSDRVASGEFLAMVLDCTGASPNIVPYKGKIGLNIVSDSAQLQYYELLVPKHSQHQNAAILFSLYLMTPEGQRSMAENMGVDLDYYPETQQHKLVADLEAKGFVFRRINYPFWNQNPGLDETGNRLGKALKASLGG
ncbi:MAG TPA: extracellular solute-binding protein [Stellaceae bacterium]|nr:extracellular solute-binding protein [Stellaceae bacterium]